jgi:hypothetical protein
MASSVPPGILVLGPSEWLPVLGGSDSALRSELMTPLEARRKAAETLRSFGVPAILMEEHSRRPGENNFAMFLRLIKDFNIKTYVVIWPLGAKLHGLGVELGYLLQCISVADISPDDVFLMAEQGVAVVQEDESGEVFLTISGEKGNRSKYYEDLKDEGCPIIAWETLATLRFAMLNVVMEHANKHGLMGLVNEAIKARETVTDKSGG